MRRRSPIRESAEVLTLGEEDVAYRLRRSSARRTLALRVTEQAEVVVNAPLRLGGGEIEGFLRRHLDWLLTRRREARERAFSWRDGARLPFLGREWVLRLLDRPGRAVVWLEGEALFCAAPAEMVETAVLNWYRREARALLGERLAIHAARTGRSTPVMRLSNARTRWGSLSPAGVVSLNWRLVKAPLGVVDYVICHELAHFRQRNHSAAFWREVELLCSDWKSLRSRLKLSGKDYFLF